MKDKEDLINREFLVAVTHTKGLGFVWTFVEDSVVGEKEEYREIGVRGFDYKLFQEEEGGGVRKCLYGYPYLNHFIEL